MALPLRVLTRTLAGPALRRAIPVYAGVGIFAAVLFGPTGMSPRTLTTAAQSSVGFCAGLWLVWLVLITPAVRAAFTAPGAAYLRALPIAPFEWWAWLAVLAIGLQLPWMALWWAGAGPVSALGAGFGTAGLGVLFGVRPRSLAEGLLGLAVVSATLALVLVAPAPRWMAVAPVFAGALLVAWARAPEQASAAILRRARISGPLVALVRSHLAMLSRERRAAWSRGLALGLGGGSLAGLFARSNQIAGVGISQLALAVGSVTLTIVAGVLAAPVLESERRARWLLDSCGVDGARRVLGAGLGVAAALALPGLAHGAAAALIAGADSWAAARAMTSTMILAIALGAIALFLARRSERADGIDGSRLVSLMAGAAIAALVAVGALGELGLVPVVATAVLASALAPERALAPHRRWRT